MAKHGGSRHLTRLAAPKTWKIVRKGTTGIWTVKPRPGPHPMHLSVPLAIIVRDYLGYAKTLREAKKLIARGYFLIDGVPRKDYKFPVGLMDTISIPEANEYYRVTLDSLGRISLIEIKKEEANLKICRIKRKQMVKGGKIQITLHDGRNILFDNYEEGNKFKVGDSVLIEVPSQKILDHIPLQKGVLAFLIGGSHMGELAEVVDFKHYYGPQPDQVVLKGEKGLVYETLEDYVFVVGRDKPLVTIK